MGREINYQSYINYVREIMPIRGWYNSRNMMRKHRINRSFNSLLQREGLVKTSQGKGSTWIGGGDMPDSKIRKLADMANEFSKHSDYDLFVVLSSISKQIDRISESLTATQVQYREPTLKGLAQKLWADVFVAYTQSIGGVDKHSGAEWADYAVKQFISKDFDAAGIRDPESILHIKNVTDQAESLYPLNLPPADVSRAMMDITQALKLAKLKADYSEQHELLVPESIDFRFYGGKLRLVFNNGKSEMHYNEAHGGVPIVTFAGNRYNKHSNKVLPKLVQATEFQAGEWYVVKHLQNFVHHYILVLNKDEAARVTLSGKGIEVFDISDNIQPQGYYRVKL